MAKTQRTYEKEYEIQAMKLDKKNGTGKVARSWEFRASKIKCVSIQGKEDVAESKKKE